MAHDFEELSLRDKMESLPVWLLGTKESTFSSTKSGAQRVSLWVGYRGKPGHQWRIGYISGRLPHIHHTHTHK